MNPTDEAEIFAELEDKESFIELSKRNLDYEIRLANFIGYSIRERGEHKYELLKNIICCICRIDKVEIVFEFSTGLKMLCEKCTLVVGEKINEFIKAGLVP